MLQGEHSAILLTFIKLPFVTKIFVLSFFFEWPFYTGFTVGYNKINFHKRCLKFSTLVFLQKGIGKQCKLRSRSSVVKVFPVRYSDKHFVNSSPRNHHFI